MDLDVEAMLEAPFMEKPSEESNSQNMETQPDESSSRYESRRHSPSRSHRSHSRHRSRHRTPSHDRHRYRSRSRSGSHREDKYREERRHRSREHRHRSRSPRRRSRSHDRYSRRHRSRSYSPPVPPEERDRRTVFVTQLAQRLRTRDFHDFFAQAGRVRDARIISDRNTRRSKGVGYVEFYDESSVQTALALSGQKLAGIPVMVQLTEAEKNRLALQAQNAENAAAEAGAPAAATVGAVTTAPVVPGIPAVPIAPIIHHRPHIPHIIQQAPPPPTHDIMEQRLYVGSVNYTLTDNDLRQVFEPYGPIDFVDLHRDNITGRSKGYAFIQFKNVKDAKEALAKMNGFELAGRNLKVGMVTERAPGAPNGFNANTVDSGLDDDSNGISLNSTSRAELMKKLAARESGVLNSANNILAQPQQPQPQQQLHQPLHIVKPPVILPSRTVKLENMFNPAEETEPEWVKDLEVDIKEECQQYGAVEHINVDGDSLGDVYLKFNSIDAGQRAIQALNGRWFGGRQIRATFMTEAIYNTRFSL